MSRNLPNVSLRNIENVRRMKILVPERGEVRGHLIAESIQDAAKPSQYLGRNLAAQIDGSPNVPNIPSAIQAKHLGGGMIDVAISDQAQHPATNYFVELADNSGFSGARVVYSGPSRNALVGPVPNGNWHIRAYSQFQYSGSQSNGNQNPPATKVAVTGSIVTGTLLTSQGSGTGNGQTPGSGFGEL